MRVPRGFVASAVVVFVITVTRPASADVSCAPMGTAAPRLALSLRLAQASLIPRSILGRAQAEAAAIWSRYGVDVFVDDTPCPAPPGAIRLQLVVESRSTGKAETPLGALGFAADGAPIRVVRIFYADVVRFADHGGVVQSVEPTWPAGWRDLVIGRTLGRVIAHEIGHFLLRSTRHARTGLMRAVQSGPELCMGPTDWFRLSDDDTARLAIMLRRDDVPTLAGTPQE